MIINQDPEEVVPNICEKDAQDHVIVIRLSSEDDIYLGMLTKHSGVYHWRGSRKRSNGFSEPVSWGWLRLESQQLENTTLMQILINSYKYYKELDFEVTFYVIKDITELLNVLRGDI